MDILNQHLYNREYDKALNYCRTNSLFEIGSKIGEWIPQMVHSISTLLDYGICLYYSGKITNAFDVFNYLLKERNCPQDLVKNLMYNISFCFPKVLKESEESEPNFYRLPLSYQDIVNIQVNNKIVEPLVLNTPSLSSPSFITFTITTCKRLDLFTRTMDSFLKMCLDKSLIDRWICVDDNSSTQDREEMKKRYPFFEFYWKTPAEKGHPQSMNIIHRLTKGCKYLWHQEDDWVFFTPDRYITKALEIINCSPGGQVPIIGQVLVNKNYIETEKDHDSVGSIPFETATKQRWYLHQYFPKDLPKEYQGKKSSCYWPHYSLRVSLLRRDVLDRLGFFNETVSHFEMEYAYRYQKANFVSAFMEGFSCYHIGRLTSERFSNEKNNAYSLNDEAQFSGKEYKEKYGFQVTNTESQKGVNLYSGNLDFSSHLSKVWVLNLDRRPDRIEDFKKVVPSGLSWERFPAVDGSKIQMNRWLDKLFEPNDFNWRKGVIGCALSHIMMWKEISNKNEPYLILEDDITFENNFMEKLLYLLENTDPDWDILFLGHFFYDEKNNKNDQELKASRWSREKASSLSMGGTIGYLIKPSGALKLLDFVNQKGITNGIDWVMLKAIDSVSKYGQLKFYYSEPKIIHSECWRGNNKCDSDIQFTYDTLKRQPSDMLVDDLNLIEEQTGIEINEMNLLTSEEVSGLSLDLISPVTIVKDCQSLFTIKIDLQDKYFVINNKIGQYFILIDKKYQDKLEKFYPETYLSEEIFKF